MCETNKKKHILIIEPFYGGSHKKLIEILISHLSCDSYDLITMTPKKWPWRARTSSLYISLQIPKEHEYKVLFCTSVLPLAELLGVRPDLVKLLKVVYFHENQLVYPVRVVRERDYQYGYNEILTALAADKVLFNSRFNKTSFLSHLNSYLKMQPDYKIKDLAEVIADKCTVVYYPLDLNKIDKFKEATIEKCHNDTLHIVWPHRWEFDKNPDGLFKIICKLDENNLNFKISILGESYSQKPPVFEDLQRKFPDKLAHCGYVASESDYYKILMEADVVLSTAIHEFFGVAVMEAVYCGCVPVVPRRLAYKEFYEEHCEEMYSNDSELLKVLTNLCHKKAKRLINKDYKYLVLPFDSKIWLPRIVEIFNLQE